MNFELTPEQKQLADSVSKYLINEYSFDKRKAIINSESGVSESAWQTFADMGLTAMTLSEADNGFGGDAMDLMAVMEAMGEALVVEPFLDNVGLAGRLVSRMGSDAQRAALLPGLIMVPKDWRLPTWSKGIAINWRPSLLWPKPTPTQELGFSMVESVLSLGLLRLVTWLFQRSLPKALVCLLSTPRHRALN
jgi:alkylation response protein AidB-like acyl-CoA dehydrogenase